MPKILSRTPRWISHGAPGYSLFAADAQRKQLNGAVAAQPTSLPLKTVVCRGTEIFYATGNELRWSDLVYLQELGQKSAPAHADAPYKILQHKTHGQIRQLILSPREDYIAIVTSHTVHIAVLPDAADLETESDTIKLKQFHLGPTAHVLDQASLASVLWHPLGEEGKCLITITSDAVLRIWELNLNNRSSFQNPSLSMDLKKLANATTANEDLRASNFGAPTPFSPDVAELEPAGACFGGLGISGEDPWSAMTLWIETKEGDAYALCPLLPSRWQIAEWHISSLVLAGILHAAEQEVSDTEISRWVLNVADQEPILRKGSFGSREANLYTRPAQPGPIPKLQGPFVLIPQPDDEDPDGELIEFSDILVLDLGAEPDPYKEIDQSSLQKRSQGLPSLIVLSTVEGKVHLALNFDRVQPQWLPQQTDHAPDGLRWRLPENDFKALIVVETLQPQEDSPSRFSTSFTRDCNSPYSFFFPFSGGIAYVSMDSWLQPLREELFQATVEQTESRLDLLFSQYSTLMDFPILFQNATAVESEVAAPVVLRDSDLGYFLLAVADGLPYVAIMDAASDASQEYDQDEEYAGELGEGFQTLMITQAEAREPYQPAHEFYLTSELSSITDDLPAYHRSTLKDQMKLSPMSLEVLTKAHRMLAKETNVISIAAADLFRRCKRLLEEFQGQIREVDELADKVAALPTSTTSSSELHERLDHCRSKGEELAERRKKLAQRLARVSQQELSEKEKAWKAEAENLESRVPQVEAADAVSEDPLLSRLEQLQHLRKELISEAKRLSEEAQTTVKTRDSHGAMPTEYRKQKLAQVDALLETERALIEAVAGRLERLCSRESKNLS